MARISAAQQYGWTDNLNVNRFATDRRRYLEEKEEVKNCVSRILKYLNELVVDRAKHGYLYVTVRVHCLVEIVEEELDAKYSEFVVNHVIEKVKLIGYHVSKKYLDNMEMWEYLEYLVISWDVV